MITVISPTCRPEGIPILEKCLKRQTFKDFEWIIVCPTNCIDPIEKGMGDLNVDITILEEPPKREGDYYSLNKAWNHAFKEANGELIVNLVDWTWFPPDVLEKLWIHYQTDPKSCVSGIGHQYKDIVNGKPENRVWTDPRARLDQGSYYEVTESEMELCLASFPRQAVIDIGGFDDEYDRGCACSEKEAMLRMYRAGYKLYIDQDLLYRAFKHDRIGGSEAWDKGYGIACELLAKHRKEIAECTRLNIHKI
jgi:hypothetical protein